MVIVAIGANLPGKDGSSPLQTCKRVSIALDRIAGLRLLAVSNWYETTPIPASAQPAYVNGAAALLGAADPVELLARLQAIEAAEGRVRGEANAARTLDLDIIAMGACMREAPDPILPHPRMHLRAFVLRPLLDLAPDWQHPVLHRSAAALLASLPDQGVRRLPSSHLQ